MHGVQIAMPYRGKPHYIVHNLCFTELYIHIFGVFFTLIKIFLSIFLTEYAGNS